MTDAAPLTAAFADNLPVDIAQAFFALDLDWRISYVDPEAERLFGKKREDLVGKGFWGVFPEAESSIFAQECRRALEDQAPAIWEEFLVPQGKWFEVRAQPSPSGISVHYSNITERKRSEARLAKINECFLNFGPDPLRNIDRLTALCGELLEADCALYNRLEEGLLCSTGQWSTPPGYNPVDKPEGHICFDVIRRGRDEMFLVRDLQDTVYARTDPNVAPYQLQTYIGYPVRLKDSYVGSLCAVFQRDVVPTDEDERILGIIASAIGVEEERKSDEVALRRSETQFRAMFEWAAIGIAIVREARPIMTNPAFREMLGYSEEELRGMELRDFTHPDDIEADMVLYNELRAGKRDHFRKEKRYIHKDGRVVWGRVTASLVRGPEGEPLFSIGMVEDVTARKRVEQALRESEEKYRLLVETANDAIFVADTETGRIIEANKRAEHMLGLPAEEIVGLPQMELHPPEEAERYAEIFREYVGKGTGIVGDIYAWNRAGANVPIEISSSVMELGGRRLILGIFRDVSERKQAQQLSEALNRLNAEINSTLEFDQIMQRVVEESARAIGAESAGVSLREGDHWVTRHIYGLPSERLGRRIHESQATATTLAVSTGKPLAISDAYEDARINQEEMKRLGVRSVLIIPLIVRDQAIGALAFNYHSAPVTFIEAQLDFAAKLAASVSLAIENANLYASQRNIALTLQEALLTVPAEIDGVDFGYLYRSATRAALVGGDFYDLFELEGHRVGIVVGDVSGKGLEAASLAATVKNTIKAYSFQEFSPASIMAKTSELVGKTAEPSVFVTVFFGILNTRSGMLTYCSAGHPPSMVKRATSEVSLLATNSPPIGVSQDLEFFDDKEPMSPGDALFLYTDGATEARCPDGLFGEDRLLEVLRASREPSPQELVQSVFSSISESTGGHLSDDLALVATSLRPSP